jgi:hypothetical protein
MFGAAADTAEPMLKPSYSGRVAIENEQPLGVKLEMPEPPPLPPLPLPLLLLPACEVELSRLLHDAEIAAAPVRRMTAAGKIARFMHPD